MADIHANFVRGNDVFICGEFDITISANVIPAFAALIESESTKKNPVITIYINSGGGNCSELWGLLSMIALAKKAGITVNTVIIGVAYSCASILAVHGDHRSMSANSMHLMHLGRVRGSVETFEQADRLNTHTNQHFNKIVELYEKYTKLKKSKIIELMKDDLCYMYAEDCLKNGLVDEIF